MLSSSVYYQLLCRDLLKCNYTQMYLDKHDGMTDHGLRGAAVGGSNLSVALMEPANSRRIVSRYSGISSFGFGPGRFGPGSFRPNLVGRFGLIFF